MSEPSDTSSWGWLEPYEKFGRLGDSKDDYKVIPYTESKTSYPTFTHASHGMIFARDDRLLWKLYRTLGSVLMQMRFDGVLGFPGGLVEEGEDPVHALNREMEEEIGLDLSKHSFTDSNHVSSFVHQDKNLVLHFYMLEVSVDEFKALELRNLEAREYGNETFGIVRPPLFTMGDGIRGLPAFLANHFAGNSKQELLLALQKSELLKTDELQRAMKASQTFQESTISPGASNCSGGS